MLCHYKLSLTDGTVIDDTRERNTVQFALNETIKGFAEGLKLMKEGSRYILYIPADLAFGSQSVGYIPANAVLVYDVELIEVIDWYLQVWNK